MSGISGYVVMGPDGWPLCFRVDVDAAANWMAKRAKAMITQAAGLDEMRMTLVPVHEGDYDV